MSRRNIHDKCSKFYNKCKSSGSLDESIRSYVSNCGFYDGTQNDGKNDLILLHFPEGSSVSGVYSNSSILSCTVDITKKVSDQGGIECLVVNSGNANSFTREEGLRRANFVIAKVAEKYKLDRSKIAISSTGIIGQQLDCDKFEKGIDSLKSENDLNELSWATATTDTFPKIFTENLNLQNGEVFVSGIAKGSGMIEPNMSTMLSFVFTNAKIPKVNLDELIKKIANQSFNRITVDGDRSTNDTFLIISTNEIDLANNNERFKVEEVLLSASQSLAKQIVMDGEGISKFITIKVAGAYSEKEADIVAKSIANSLLVKTAIAGSDPNWGRIVMAIGKTMCKLNKNELVIKIGSEQITPLDRCIPNMQKLTNYMKGDEIEIYVNLMAGESSAEVYTCDLTHEYVSINSDYSS